MSPEYRHKAVLHRLVEEMFNQGDFTQAHQFFTADFVNHAAAPGTPPGPGHMADLIMAIHLGIPDTHMTIEDTVAEGDKLAARITWRGTHLGDIWGLEPTGKKFVQEQLHIFRFENGRVAEHWAVRDDLGMFRQLGLTPG